MNVKPIIGRVGGKARLAPWIIEHLKRFQWSIYCEPFCGSAAVYFRMVSDGIFEQIRDRGQHPRIVLNDADSRIVQLFRTCRDHPELLAYAVAMTPYSREEHRLAQQSSSGDLGEIEKARRYLLAHSQSCNGKEIQSGWSICTGEGDSVPGTGRCDRWNVLPQRILAASPHLQGEFNPIDSPYCLNDLGRRFVQPPVDARVEMARQYLVDAVQSFKDDPGNTWKIARNQGEVGDVRDHIEHQWSALPSRLLAATQHLKRCYIENDDAVKCMERWARGVLRSQSQKWQSLQLRFAPSASSDRQYD